MPAALMPRCDGAEWQQRRSAAAPNRLQSVGSRPGTVLGAKICEWPARCSHVSPTHPATLRLFALRCAGGGGPGGPAPCGGAQGQGRPHAPQGAYVDPHACCALAVCPRLSLLFQLSCPWHAACRCLLALTRPLPSVAHPTGGVCAGRPGQRQGHAVRAAGQGVWRHAPQVRAACCPPSGCGLSGCWAVKRAFSAAPRPRPRPEHARTHRPGAASPLLPSSAGDLLRAHMKGGSPEGQMVADMIKNGQIVPSHVSTCCACSV